MLIKTYMGKNVHGKTVYTGKNQEQCIGRYSDIFPFRCLAGEVSQNSSKNLLWGNLPAVNGAWYL